MRKRLFLLPLCALLASCGEAGGSSLEKEDQSVNLYYCFNTTVTVRLYDAPKGLGDEVEALLEKCSALLDTFEGAAGYVNCYDLNKTNAPTAVDPLLYEALKEAYDFQLESQGEFNILLGNVTSLWKNALNDPDHALPSDSTIAGHLANSLSSSLVFGEDYTVTRLGKGQLDTGAFGKGFALKKAVELLQQNGVTGYVMNAGSSSLALGTTKDGEAWRIATTGDDSGKVYLGESTSIGTSGYKEQYFIGSNGSIYSHIVDPKNGSAKVTHSYDTVTLLGDDAMIDDMMSTILFLRGDNDLTRSLAEEYGVSYAFHYPKNGTDSWESHGIEFVDA